MLCAYRFCYRLSVFTYNATDNIYVTNGVCCMQTCNRVINGNIFGNNAREDEIHFLLDCE
jgi:hypothetical protein